MAVEVRFKVVSDKPETTWGDVLRLIDIFATPSAKDVVVERGSRQGYHATVDERAVRADPSYARFVGMRVETTWAVRFTVPTGIGAVIRFTPEYTDQNPKPFTATKVSEGTWVTSESNVKWSDQVVENQVTRSGMQYEVLSEGVEP